MSTRKPQAPSYAEREAEAVLRFAMGVYTDPASTSEDREAARERLVHPPGSLDRVDWEQVSLEERDCLLAAMQRIGELKKGDYDGEPVRLVTAEEWPLVEMLYRGVGAEQDGINPSRLPEHEAAFLRAATHRIARLRMAARGYAGAMYEPANPPLRMMTPEEAAILDALRLTPVERRLALAAAPQEAELVEHEATPEPAQVAEQVEQDEEQAEAGGDHDADNIIR